MEREDMMRFLLEQAQAALSAGKQHEMVASVREFLTLCNRDEVDAFSSIIDRVKAKADEQAISGRTA